MLDNVWSVDAGRCGAVRGLIPLIEFVSEFVGDARDVRSPTGRCVEFPKRSAISRAMGPMAVQKAHRV